MSVSRHPVALLSERRVGSGSRLLATVMALPLLDGLFPALLLAGALDDPVGVLEVGLLVFGGSATLAVVVAEMGDDHRQTIRATLAVGVLIVIGAVIEAALAPTVARLIDLATFERFAAVVVLAVAARTASARVAAVLPRPGIIVALGLVASVDPAGTLAVLGRGPEVVGQPGLVVRGGLAAAIGAGFAVIAAVVSPWLHTNMDLDRFRFGSAVALGVLALSILGLVPADAPLALAVFGVSALLAFEPSGRLGRLDRTDGSSESTVAPDVTRPDGGSTSPPDDSPPAGSDQGPTAPDAAAARPPWL